ncbi:class I SAM-dependent methyltransferase [Paenibacillus solisilvae]|uniref:Class I SAM-dependent methyltransferase n=1 Tax=Paenibacillus solisilvae TaxID=2486751 RepID=A0ABW0VQV7_9BACL
MGFLSVLSMAHKLIKERVSPGDLVVDATCGNGVDTLMLAELTGPRGCVYAFDIQEQALERTRDRLAAAFGDDSAAESPSHIEGNGSAAKQKRKPEVHLVLDSHEAMANHIPVGSHGRAAAVMFNLGYLPGADQTVITKPETTIAALDSAVRLLRIGGIITVVLYPGHSGGDTETREVEQWASSLSVQDCQSVIYRMAQRADAPYLIAIEKKVHLAP